MATFRDLLAATKAEIRETDPRGPKSRWGWGNAPRHPRTGRDRPGCRAGFSADCSRQSRGSGRGPTKRQEPADRRDVRGRGAVGLRRQDPC